MGRVAFQGLGQVQAGNLTATLEERYNDLRAGCIDNFGQDFCNAVLPRNLIYAVTRKDTRPTVPWWGWMIMGAIAGRFFR